MNFKIPIISKFKRQNSTTNKNNKYNNYPDNIKEWCDFRDKAQPIWNLAFQYTQNINENYSLFINNNLNEKYFDELFINCNKYIELLPNLIELQKEENNINKTNYSLNYCIAYHKLALAYEKLEKYDKAIEICKEAVEKGFYDDKTKNGFKGRIEKLKKKIK